MLIEQDIRFEPCGAYVSIACGAGDEGAEQILKELDRIARVCRANHCRAVLADGAEEVFFSAEAIEAFAESSSRAQSEIERLAVAFCVDKPARGGVSLAEIGTADGAVRVGFFDQRAEALAWLAAGRV